METLYILNFTKIVGDISEIQAIYIKIYTRIVHLKVLDKLTAVYPGLYHHVVKLIDRWVLRKQISHPLLIFELTIVEYIV